MKKQTIKFSYIIPFLRLHSSNVNTLLSVGTLKQVFYSFKSTVLHRFFLLFSLRSSCCLAPSYSNPTQLKQRSRYQTWAIMPKTDKSKGSHQKKRKTMKFWTLSEKGGGISTAPQPNFLSMKSMDMCIEGRGLFCR